MKAAERRKAIVNLLLSSNEAISGSTLSAKFGVSRQIIVQDMTVLKGLGYEILSTHSGYIMRQTPLKERVFKLQLLLITHQSDMCQFLFQEMLVPALKSLIH